MCASSAVRPQTAKVIDTMHKKCLVKMEKILSQVGMYRKKYSMYRV